MIKRLLLIFIIFVLAFNVSVSAKSEYDFFAGTGILGANYEALSSEKVSRGTFAKVIVSLIDMEEMTVSQYSEYSDVDGSSDEGKAIITLTRLGVMSGYDDGTFKPQRELKISEAVKIIVQLMGYGYKANSMGGYPSGYMYTANELKLLSGIKGAYTDDISGEDALTLLYNCLDKPVAEISKVGENLSYTIDENNTVLSKYHNMVKASGIVTATSTAALSGYYETDKNQIRIGSDIYFAEGISALDYIGLTVDFIYKIDENTGNKNIIIVEDDGKNKVKEISIDDYEGITGNTISYTNNDKTEKITFSKTADVIYNGQNGVINKEILEEIEEGTIRLLSTKRNGDYNLIVIDNYENIIVGKKDETGKKVYDEKEPGKFVDLNEKNKQINIYSSNGAKLNFNIISRGDVLTVRDNSRICEAYITSSSVSGLLDKISYSNDKAILTVEGKEVKLTKKASKNINLNPGENIRISIDRFGFGASVKILSKEGFEFVYLIKLGYKENGVEQDVSAKIFRMSSGLETVKLSKNIIVDGKMIRNAEIDKIKNALHNKTEKLIGIKTNEDGEVINIINPKSLKELMDEKQDGFVQTHSLSERKYGSDPPQLARAFMIKKNTPVIQIPLDVDNAADEDFTMTTANIFSDENYINCEAYNSSVDYGIPEFIVYRPKSGAASVPALRFGTPLVVVKEKSTVVDDEGKPAIRIKVQNGSSEKFFYYDGSDVSDTTSDGVKYSVSDLGKGDVIRYSADSQNYIRLMNIFYDYDKGLWLYNSSFTTTGYLMTEVKNVVDSYVHIPYWYDGSSDLFGVVDLTEKTLKSGGVSIIKDRNGLEPIVSGGTTADVSTGDRVIIHLAYGQLIGIILLR